MLNHMEQTVDSNAFHFVISYMTKTYAQLAKEIESLQSVAKRLFVQEAKRAVEKVNQLVAKYQLAPGDLRFPQTDTTKVAVPTQKGSRKARQSTVGKYSDGTGHSWSGFGPRPAWVRAAIAAGRSLESFLSAGHAVAGSSKTAAPSRVISPKYRNEVTGDVWSGRGSQPRWLKAALKKRNSRLEDFLIEAQAATAKQQETSAKPSRKSGRPAAATHASPSTRPSGAAQAPKTAARGEKLRSRPAAAAQKSAARSATPVDSKKSQQTKPKHVARKALAKVKADARPDAEAPDPQIAAAPAKVSPTAAASKPQEKAKSRTASRGRKSTPAEKPMPRPTEAAQVSDIPDAG